MNILTFNYSKGCNFAHILLQVALFILIAYLNIRSVIDDIKVQIVIKYQPFRLIDYSYKIWRTR